MMRGTQDNVDPESLPKTYREILPLLTSDDSQVAELVLGLCRDLYDEEMRRRSAIESKAADLVRFTGLAVTLVLGLGALLVDRQGITSHWALVPIGVFYLLIIYKLLEAVLSAEAATKTEYVQTVHPSDVIKYQKLSHVETKKDLAASYLAAYQGNCSVSNRKSSAVREAQVRFRNAIVGLFCIAILLVSYSLFGTLVMYLVGGPMAGLFMFLKSGSR